MTKRLRNSAVVAVAAVSILAAGTTPASAGVLSQMSWATGSGHIISWANSATCEFIDGHHHLMRIPDGATYDQAYAALHSDFVQHYMARRVDQGSKQFAAFIPVSTHQDLQEIGIAAVLDRTVQCGLVSDPAGKARANLAYWQQEGAVRNSLGSTVPGTDDIGTLQKAFSS